MYIYNKFCCCIDLRYGCLIYAWLQMVPVSIVLGKLSWMSFVIKDATTTKADLILSGQLDLIVGIQWIKLLASFALIWGIIKTQHMFYQPWLFINGLENSLLIIPIVLFFILGFKHHIGIIYVLAIPLLIAAVHGWYIWSRVYIVYKRDIKPSSINFEETRENSVIHIV